MNKYILCLLLFVSGFGFSQSSNQLIKEYLSDNSKELRLVNSGISDWIIESEANSNSTGINNYYVKQRYLGIEIVGAVTNFSIKNQKIINVGNRFEPNIAKRINTSSPKIQILEALSKANNILNIPTKTNESLEKIASHKYKISNGLLKNDPIRAELVFFPISDGDIRLAWDFNFYSHDYNHLWSIKIDAVNGNLLDKKDLVLRCNFGNQAYLNNNHPFSFATNMFKNTATILETQSGSYRVLPYNVESPDHGPRQLIVSPHDVIASPFGWHDTNGVEGNEYTITRGNNVWAKEDLSGNNESGISPEGGANLTFDFPYGGTDVIATNYIDAATTNLFYMNNIMHDIFYQYGFNEANGNFQENNYNKTSQSGTNNDSVLADSQDGSGLNNANFSTPVDGQRPRMQMFLWNRQPPKKIITINSPADIVGEYEANDNVFTAGHVDLPASPMSLDGDLALFEDGTPETSDGCSTAINQAQLNGKIAVIRRGECNFVVKVKNAQLAGAIAVIIVNNVTGQINMSGEDGSITIPAISITKEFGDIIIEKMTLGQVNASLSMPFSSYINADSDFDNGVIAHEYSHGVSTRLTGGPANSNCLQSAEQMGEGWSDFFALMLQMKAGENGSEKKGIATFLANQPIDGDGIRIFPYSTDMTINPLTYGNTNGMTFEENGEIKINVHSVGTVWATILWDLAWKYVEKYGFDSNVYTGTGGNNKILQLVTDALKLQPCNPSFVSGRNALLLADRETTGGVDNCMIWEVFARRGLGINASAGSNSGVSAINDQVEDFTMPAPEENCTAFLAELSNRVYPNPSNGLINIHIKEYVGKVNLQVFDINGRVVYSIENDDFNMDKRIDLGSLQSGVYILKIVGEQLNYSQKIILN